MGKQWFFRVVFAVLFCVFMQLPVYAAFVNLDKVKVRIEIKPGNSAAGVVTVENKEKKPVFVKIYAMDWKYIAPYDGSKDFFPLGTLPTTVGKWFEFSPASLRLGPEEKKIVHYRIDLPKDVKGGHYLVLFFETESKGRNVFTKNRRVGLQLLTRIGTLFFVEPNTAVNRSVSIEDCTVDLRSGQAEVTVDNKGDVFLVGKLSVFLMNQSTGMVLVRSEFRKLYMPDRTKAKIAVKLIGDLEKLEPGQYSALITLQPEVGNPVSVVLPVFVGD